MTARMLLIEARRGPSPILVLAALGLGGATALGAGCDAVVALREAMWLVFPFMLAAGVWRGGSARRRHVDEAIAAGSLPSWRRTAVEGGSLALAGAAAAVVLLGAAALTGGCTAVTAEAAAAAAVAVAALAAAAFAGLSLGRLASAPIAAPLVLFLALAVSTVLGGWSAGNATALLMLPGVAEDGTELPLRISAAQLLWFAGLAVSGWLLASRFALAGLAPAAAGLAALWALA
jgi:hypothetical protein